MADTTTCAPATDSIGILDLAFRQVSDGDVYGGMESLLITLTDLRHSLSRERWRDFCEQLRRHPIRHLVHQAPFTRRAFEKPRGYPGDALTLDYIYGIEPLPPGRTQLIERLYAWEFQTPSCRSVRARKTMIAQYIDDVASCVTRPRILSLACGHLREARESDAVLSRSVEFFAVDQDNESLTVVHSALGEYGVHAVTGSVRGVLANRIAYQGLDLAYAAGLYDYLSDAIAAQLSLRLFNMLGAGGRLVVPNFNLSLRDIGYLEAFMDWHLLYRDDEAMIALTRALPVEQVASTRLFHEKHRNITFLEVVRT